MFIYSSSRVALIGAALMVTSAMAAFVPRQNIPNLPVPLPTGSLPAPPVPRDILPGGNSPLAPNLVHYEAYHSRRVNEDGLSLITPEGEQRLVHDYHGRAQRRRERKDQDDHFEGYDQEGYAYDEFEDDSDSLDSRDINDHSLVTKTNGFGVGSHHYDDKSTSSLMGGLQPRNDVPLHSSVNGKAPSPTGTPSKFLARATVDKALKVGGDDTGINYHRYQLVPN